jgi:thioredoxin reductase (NADPH)
LQGLVVKHIKTGDLHTVPAAAMFIFIGVRPHTSAFAGLLELDASGFVLTGTDLPIEHGRSRGWPLARAPYTFETSVPGVFSAGDVRSGANRRVAAAVGDGSAAVCSVH